MKISGNTVLITGGGSGIGLALAGAMLAHGNTVVIAGRDPEKLAAAAERYPALHTFRTDITREEDLQQLVKHLREHFPRLNMLVNNAGAACITDIRTDAAAYDKMQLEAATNYLAPVRLTQLLLAELERNKPSAIINITTIAVQLPISIMPGYSASKAALSSFTRSLRLQLAEPAIRVFEVLPPPVDTDMVKMFHIGKLDPARLAEAMLTGLAKDRLVMPIGTARPLLWLARLAPRMLEKQSHRQLLKATRGQ